MSGSFPNNQANPDGAIPVYVVPQRDFSLVIYDFSGSVGAGEAATFLSENYSRRYLFIQCVTPNVDIWINSVGGDAAPETTPSWKLAAGQSYESGQQVITGAISVYAAEAADITVLEG